MSRWEGRLGDSGAPPRLSPSEEPPETASEREEQWAEPLPLIADLGRAERFLNMLRIFKPRSPMNLGAWCLMAFSGGAASSVAADLLKRRRLARAFGAMNAVLGGYLGSYTGVLLASTA